MENERVSEINGRTDPDPPRSGLVQLLSEPFRPRRCWPPIPNSSTRLARLLVEPYRSLATRKSSHVFRQLLPPWRPIPLLARSLSPRRHRVFKLSVAGPLDFERLGPRDSAHGCKSSSCLHRGAPATPVPSGYRTHLPADAWRKNGVMNDTSPALLSPRCEQPLARLFVALIREDDACTVVR